MSRKLLIRSKEHPYHITGRVNNKEPYPCTLEEAWQIHLKQLNEIELKYSAKIHAFVLMGNHFHLVISTPREDLGIVMKNFMQSVTRIINSRTGRTGRIFGSRYNWSLVDSMDYFDCAIKYVYRNPVKANIVHSVLDYQFSTVIEVFGYRKGQVSITPPIGETLLIPNNNPKEFLEWLNTPFKTEEYNEIHQAFKKQRFKPWQSA
jgi:putative transposase